MLMVKFPKADILRKGCRFIKSGNFLLEQGRMEGISSMVTALKNVEQDEETILSQIMTLYNLKEEEAKKYL